MPLVLLCLCTSPLLLHSLLPLVLFGCCLCPGLRCLLLSSLLPTALLCLDNTSRLWAARCERPHLRPLKLSPPLYAQSLKGL